MSDTTHPAPPPDAPLGGTTQPVPLTGDGLYRQTISDLLNACEGVGDDPAKDPEAYAAVYWARAVLNPERYAHDHPSVAERLKILSQPAPVAADGAGQGEQPSRWNPMATAPRDGTRIIGLIDDQETEVRWAETRHCMAASAQSGGNGHFGPGWADVENGLIADEPTGWKPVSVLADDAAPAGAEGAGERRPDIKTLLRTLEHDTLVERSVGAMAIADGDDGWERVPLDCPMLVSVAALRRDRDKLQAFKDYVHARLDAAGVPHHPPGPHGAEGCRVGDRMDWLMAKLAATERVWAEWKGRAEAIAATYTDMRTSNALSWLARRRDVDTKRVAAQILTDHKGRLGSSWVNQASMLRDLEARIERELSALMPSDAMTRAAADSGTVLHEISVARAALAAPAGGAAGRDGKA